MVKVIRGLVVIIVNAASSKTFTCDDRIGCSIIQKNFLPKNLLVATFTNKAPQKVPCSLETGKIAAEQQCSRIGKQIFQHQGAFN